MRHLFLVVLLTIFVHGQGQNLVPNPSFENLTGGEPNFGCEFSLVNDWINPSGLYCYNFTSGTPDIFSHFATGYSELPNSFMGYTEPHTGDRCTGLVSYHQQLLDYREYMMTRLISPMIPGKKYTVSFWITSSNPASYVYHSNNIQLALTTNALVQDSGRIIQGVAPQFTLSNIVAHNDWTFYSFQIIPTQPFEYLTIGNFQTDANTLIQSFGVDRPYAYQFFDDVSVTTTTIRAFSDTTLCAGSAIQLRAENSSNGSYHWYEINNPGNYIDNDSLLMLNNVTSNMQYVATDGVDYDTVTITVIPTNFTINLGPDTSFCGDFSYTISANQSALWSTGVTADSIMVNAPGTYWAAINNSCVSTSDTITISQLQKLIIDLGPNQNICAGDSILLSTSTVVSNYLWNTGSNTQSIYASEAGIYILQAWNNQSCIAADTILVLSSEVADLSLGNDTTVCGGELILSIPISGATYVWQDNSTDSVYYVAASGTYGVTVTSVCGTASDEIHINNYADECRLSIPTAFTPNNDGINDRYGPIARCPMEKMHLQLYNRWGELVFETNDLQSRWNGMYKGINQPIGTFVYVVEYFNYCEQQLKQESGNFTLLR